MRIALMQIKIYLIIILYIEYILNEYATLYNLNVFTFLEAQCPLIFFFGGHIHSSELLYTDSQISYLLSENP